MSKKNKSPEDESSVRKSAAGERQTDLAEGELDTVEESLRIHEERGDEQGSSGRNMPNTNQFRCESCGRHFNSEEEFKRHEAECSAAKTMGSGSRTTGQGKL